MKVADTIAAKLKTGLEPSFLDVQDVSHQHAGHGGWREGGGTHFTVTITATAFAGKSRVQQHRLVNTILADDLAGDIHALELHLSS